LLCITLLSILLSPIFEIDGEVVKIYGVEFNAQGSGQRVERRYIPGVAIVKFKEGYKSFLGLKKIEIDEFNKVAGQLGITSVEPMFPEKVGKSLKRGEVDLSLFYLVRFSEMLDVNLVVSKLSRLNSVEYAEPHYIYKPNFTPNDPYFQTYQWYLRKVQLPLAWDITQGDTNVVIGIVDTGVDLDHPDLAGNIWHNWREIPNNGIDDDGNGYVDDFVGWDFGGKDNFNNDRRKQDNDPSEKSQFTEHMSLELRRRLRTMELELQGLVLNVKLWR
jgi:serine protease